MQEQRLTHRLTAHWNNLRKSDDIPRWEHFNPAALDDIWQKCALWAIRYGKLDERSYVCEYIGDEVKEALGTDPTGRLFTGHFRNFRGTRIMAKMNEVISSRAPLSDEGQFVNSISQTVKFRSCLLPFGHKNQQVTHVVLALSWKQ